MLETGNYDSEAARHVSLKKILDILNDLGAQKIYIKKLSPNDNSKNQPYFGSHLTDLPFIPTGEIVASDTTSNKASIKKNDKKAVKYQASLNLHWFDAEGNIFQAPNTSLKYYPQYPEVRLSGFLRGSRVKAGTWMDPNKKGRSEGRWLILGVSKDKTVYSYLVTPVCALSNELEKTEFLKISNVFSEIGTEKNKAISSQDTLILKLREIFNLGWIPGQKLSAQNIKEPYNAPNAAGYTLEAELGISPNGIGEPDYLGWEIKQFGVKSFPARGTTPVTLMTPEPNGGLYKEQGPEEFVRRYGYPDKSGKPDRLNFGGIHRANQLCELTKLTLKIQGFDHEKSMITDAKGIVALVDINETTTASWSFAKLMDHWKCKHSNVAYIPCMNRPSETGGKEYHFGKDIEMGIGTDFEKFLSAMVARNIYYDPGIKIEQASTQKLKMKKRSQFRIKHIDLKNLYKKYNYVDVFKENI